MQVFTIGYEGRSLAEVVAALRENEVDLLVDVRCLPLSHKPGFSKVALRQGLAASGIDYLHVGALGSPKSLRQELRATGDYGEFFAAYRARLSEVSDAFDQIVRLSGERRICLMCFERTHTRCHRSVLTETLAGNHGAGIVHL